MTPQKSGLESWRDIVETQSNQTKVELYLPLILSAAGALGVLPFAVLRYLDGDWILGVIDTAIIAGFVSLGIFVYKTHKVRFASIAISLLCILGVVSSVYAKGPGQILWAYPALMAVFYLLKPREAVGLATMMVLMLLPELFPSDNTFQTTTVLITIVVLSSFAYAFSLITNRQRELLIQLATKDPLTGAGNRRALEEKLSAAVALLKRNETPASLIILDLDHFKRVNDEHGHAVGDQILCQVSDIVNLRIRVTDSLYRIGGEEFVVVLEGQDIDRAGHLAEQLRTLIEANELLPQHPVTISLGVAELHDNETPSRWLNRADQALYEAKRNGRNITKLAA